MIYVEWHESPQHEARGNPALQEPQSTQGNLPVSQSMPGGVSISRGSWLFGTLQKNTPKQQVTPESTLIPPTLDFCPRGMSKEETQTCNSPRFNHKPSLLLRVIHPNNTPYKTKKQLRLLKVFQGTTCHNPTEVLWKQVPIFTDPGPFLWIWVLHMQLLLHPAQRPPVSMGLFAHHLFAKPRVRQ